MATTHEARHVKAVVLAATKDKERLNLRQIHVTGERIEATNGHWLLRISRPPGAAKGNGDARHDSCASSETLENVLHAKGASLIDFDDPEIVARNKVLEILVEAKPNAVEGFPELDPVIPTFLEDHRKITVSPDYFMAALKAMKTAGATRVTLFVPRDSTDAIVIKGEDPELAATMITAVIMPISAAADVVEEEED